MKISKTFFFQFFRKIVKFFCNILFVNKLNFKIFFQKEFVSVIFFRKIFFLSTLFWKFSFHEKICF